MKTVEDNLFDAIQEARVPISELTARLLEAGIPDVGVLAALFSVAGTVMGLNWQPEEWDGILETAKTPIIADAKCARKLKKYFAN